jgi:NTP pyrophosphatase (non-canonical NTP hydrolase)
VALYLFSLAAMAGVDLQAEVEAKIEKNAARVYRRVPNGVLVKDAGPGEGAHR